MMLCQNLQILCDSFCKYSIYIYNDKYFNLYLGLADHDHRNIVMGSFCGHLAEYLIALVPFLHFEKLVFLLLEIVNT